MANINLLPLELKVGSSTLKTVKLANTLAIILGAILLIVIVAGFSLNFIITKGTQNSQANSEKLRADIQKLEQVEQKLFLIKDRAQKAQSIYSSTTDVSTNIDKVNSLLTSMPTDVTLQTLTFDVGAANFSILSKSSTSMAQFVNQITQNKAFTKVTLKSFNYNPTQGYTLAIDTL